MLLALQQNMLLGGVTLVTVPDVVGETQAQGTTDLQAVGFVVVVSTAYSSVVAAGLIISQNPVGGVDYPLGGSVSIVVSLGDAPASDGAGRSRRKRQRLFVEIDGRDFEVESVAQAVALLDRAKEVAVKQVARARAEPRRVAPGIKRPSIRTDSEELRPLVREKRAEIVSLYDELLRDIEIQYLMAKADEDDEEETLLRFLM